MLEKQDISDQLITSCLHADYGLDVVALTFLPLGADMHASLYKAEAHDGTAYFVKLKRGHNHDIAVVIVQLLYDAGVQQVILPVKTNKGKLTHRIKDFTIIVYPFVEGQDGFLRDLTDSQWGTLGRALR